MSDLRRYIRDVPDFPLEGILFRDIAPLLRDHLQDTLDALSALFTAQEWSEVDFVAGIEARGFILGAALAAQQGKGFVPVRKQGKLPPPVIDIGYTLEYGRNVLEMQRGWGRLLMLDDVLATGGTLRAAATLAERAGYRIVQLASLIDLKILPTFEWGVLRARAVITY